jgi:SAM-dependent methyltransferase
MVTKPGINLTISHDFLGRGELLDFLAGNTMNAFFYDVDKHRGISSTIEHALAVRRPLAITKCGMFRHVSSASPSICIEDNSLTTILKNGTAPLAPFYEQWTEDKFTAALEKILDKALGKTAARAALTTGPGDASKPLNRILDNHARLEYFPIIARLFEVAPFMMKRKIQEANVQQAFVADTVLRLSKGASSPKTLCIGSHEDTATELLKAERIRPEEIDPSINYDLNAFFHLPTTMKGTYDVVYSTSVIEHVPDDDLFLDQICKLLKKGGVGVLTCDFNDSYRPGSPKPAVDVRLYTVNDLDVRFRRILERNGCELVDPPRWSDKRPDFVYMGIYVYSFATFVFRKVSASAAAPPGDLPRAPRQQTRSPHPQLTRAALSTGGSEEAGAPNDATT